VALAIFVAGEAAIAALPAAKTAGATCSSGSIEQI